MREIHKIFKSQKFRSLPLTYQRIYRKLSQIPTGQIISYGELAKFSGIKNGARVVGTAMRRNPFAPIIPCHRVIKSDFSIGQYAFGVAKKISLLKAEGHKIVDGKLITN